MMQIYCFRVIIFSKESELMEEKKYLNEEVYQKNRKKITKFAILVLIMGILIGGSFIAIGLVRQGKVNTQYSGERKTNLQEQLETEKQKLLQAKTELEAKIKPVEDEIKSLQREPFVGFDDAYYARKDKIDALEKSIATDKNGIAVISNTLDESFDHCKFNEAKNNTYTSEYCSLKKEINDITDFNKEFDSFESMPFYMIGGFVIIVSCMIAGSIYMFTKRRELLAFTAQQVMPVAKESIDEMAPTIGNVAKEISKGIKEGMKDDQE